LNSVNILDVNVSCLDIKGIFACVKEWVEGDLRRTNLYVNAHCLNIANEDTYYRRLLNRADIVYADGISVVWCSRILGGCKLQKDTGADWIKDFCRFAEQESIRIYILVGGEGVAQKAKDNLLKSYPEIKIVGYGDGYFINKSEVQVLSEIRVLSPQVLFVGMGTPHQERWIFEHREEISAPVCWGVGALFDYVAGIKSRIPPWMGRVGLEWSYRLIVDPAGKWERYIIGNPRFVARIIRQKLGI
jgi:N-acetylglucosaminyldiphosphoundecaprenol N-acetyl-beta-D-mannosaminyltransferase